MTPFNRFPEYFMTVAKMKSISKAAGVLHVSQPYLSQHIIRLEKALGAELFDRGKSPIELTDAGQLYLNYLESSFQLSRKLASDLDNICCEHENTLSIGLGSWRGSMLLPDILPTFRRKFPNVKISVHEHTISELYNFIDSERVEFAMMNVNWITRKGYVREVMRTEKIYLVANREHEAASRIRAQIAQTGKVELKSLENELFILLQPGIVCGDAVFSYLDRNKVFISDSILTTNNSTVVNLVAEGMGLCFLNEAVKKYASRPDCLEFFDLNSKDLEVPLAAVYKANTFLSPAARNFIDMTKEFYGSSK